MIDWRASLRRGALVTAALLLSTPLLRSSLSSAMVTRGDGLLYAGDGRAVAMYRRALFIDPRNDVAADRYAFAALLAHDPLQIEDGIRVATESLSARPHNTVLRMDRALCLQRIGRFREAEVDFERVGLENHDVQALAFAAADARKLRRFDRARTLLAFGERIDPNYLPIRHALAQVQP
jgi:tetratricopeptide (TPR) repeat protein